MKPILTCLSVSLFAVMVSGCGEMQSTPAIANDAIVDGLAHPVLESAESPKQLREVLETDQPVVVDFTATSCVPCQMLKPELKKLAEKYEGKVVVVKVDVVESPELAQQFRVEAMPTVLIIQNGATVKREVGFDENLRFKFGRILDGLI